MESEKSQKYVPKTGKENSLKTDEELLTIDPKSEKLFEQIRIEGSPFTAVKHESKWFLTMGKYRLTTDLNNFEECEEESKNASWDRIMQIIQIMIEENKTKI